MRVMLAAALAIALSLLAWQLLTSSHAGAASYTVVTDAQLYSPGDSVYITGAGYLANTSYDVVVVRPNGTIVNGSGTGAPGFDTVVSDSAGNISDVYILTKPSPAGVYIVEVFASSDTTHSVLLALTSFYDDTPYPLTISQTTSGLTVTVSGTWKWEGCISHSNSKKHVGFAIVWGDGTGVPNPYPPPAVSRDGVYPTGGPSGTWTACAPPGTGNWGPLTHTYASANSYQACVITYDVHFKTPPPPTTGEGSTNPWQNDDNSYDGYDDEELAKRQQCVPVNPAPTATPTATAGPATSTPNPATATATATSSGHCDQNSCTSTPAPATATPTPTATNTPVPPTATFTAVPTATNTPVPPTATFTAVPTATNTPVPPTATFTAVPTATNTPVPPTATFTAVPTATNTPVPPTATFTAVPTATNTPVPPTATFTAVPTATNTPVPPTATFTAVPTATNTPVPPTATVTAVPTATNTPVPPTATFTAVPTATNTPVPPTATFTAVPTATFTAVPTATFTAVPTATNTPVPPTATFTAVPTATFTAVPTATFTAVPTATFTAVPTATFTAVPTATFTAVPTATFTAVPTATFTAVPTATFTAVPTATFTAVPTATFTAVPTATFTAVPAATFTAIPAATFTPTATATITPTPGPTTVQWLKSPASGQVFLTDGTQTFQFDEVLYNQTDPNGLGGFSFDINFDPTIWQQPSVDLSPAVVLFASTGRLLSCNISLLLANVDHIVCASTGVLGTGPVFTGPKVMAHVTLRPRDIVVGQIRPNKENGIVTAVKDTNVTVANTCGQPLNDGTIQPLPGQPECQGLPLTGVLPGGLLPQSMTVVTLRRLEGDVTKDCSVDIADIQLEASKYGTAGGSLLYNVFYDVNSPLSNGDGQIDILDVQFVYGRFGSTCLSPVPPQGPQALP
ncbi:MAG: hypothetical protein KGK07_13130 [Chloroflexota bacterium]|nr:hypothetical protein [Chloroflexota bacterium]